MIGGPILRRVGTALAAYLAARGVPADHIEQLIAALTIIAGLSYDVVASLVHKQDVASRARIQAMKDFNIRQDWRV
nr:MAG: hypothetical protein [Microvirus sp.]